MDLKAGIYMVNRDKNMVPDKRQQMNKWLSGQLRRLQAANKMKKDMEANKDDLTLQTKSLTRLQMARA